MKLLISAVFILLGLNSLYAENSIPSIPAVVPVTNTNSSQYVFFFRGNSLAEELKTFAKNNNLAINISPAVYKMLQNKKISGKFTASSLNAFLSALARQYNFKWFLYTDTLYITSSNVSSISFNIPNESFSDVRRYLANVGLLVPDFGYTELTNQNKIIISGPPEYLNLVKNSILTLNINPINQGFAVFRLKYANAVDTSLSFNNQTIYIPGVATILSGMFGTNTKKGNLSTGINEMIKNGLASESGSNNEQIKNYSSSPNIQADARLNTIIIRDSTENLKLYRNIIKTLDVPAPLIQIDVLIIRLDQDKLAQSGVNWWASANNAAGGFGAANLTNNSPTNNLAMSYNQINPGQLIVTNIASFSASLQFLEDNQYAKTQAKPSLATIDNLPAVTTTTEEIFSANTNAAMMNGGQSNNSTINNLGYTGIQLIQGLQITPHVVVGNKGHRQIRLSIVLQDGSIDDFSNPIMPNYSQGYLSSQTIIDEGQSVVLAGYTKSSTVSNEIKVPFWGDIPGLGWLFKTRSTSVHRITTLYVVTPKIVFNKIEDVSIKTESNVVDYKSPISNNGAQSTSKDTTSGTKHNHDSSDNDKGETPVIITPIKSSDKPISSSVTKQPVDDNNNKTTTVDSLVSELSESHNIESK